MLPGTDRNVFISGKVYGERRVVGLMAYGLKMSQKSMSLQCNKDSKNEGDMARRGLSSK